MDSIDTQLTDENKPNIIRKKSSFLRDGSYRIFHITNKPSGDSDDDDNKRNNQNTDETVDTTINANDTSSPRRSLKIPDRNSLKQLLFLHTTSCDSSSSIEVKTSPSSCHSTNELSQSVLCADAPPEKLTEEKITDWPKTNAMDETIMRHNLCVREDKFERSGKRQVLINIHPELQASFHRRRKRFIVACGTVIIALSVITTIIVYVVIMTVKYITQMNRSTVHRYPRL